MSLALRQRETVRAALRRNLDKRIALATALLAAPPDGESSGRIHEARKQLRHVRALLRLIARESGHRRRARGTRRLRKVMRGLSAGRDASALLQALLRSGRAARLPAQSLERLRSTLEFRRNRAHAAILSDPTRHTDLLASLRNARKDVQHVSQIAAGWGSIGAGLREIYSTARTAATSISSADNPPDETWHEARKRAKDLLYALEFLRRCAARNMERRIQSVHNLTSLLGQDRDLATLQATLGGSLRRQLSQGASLRLTREVRDRRRLLQKKARAAITKVYLDDEVAFARNIHREWKHWRSRT